MYFRKSKSKATYFEFTIGSNKLEIVDNYKYLRITFTYFGKFYGNRERLAKAEKVGRRALGKIIYSIHKNKDYV